jgi:plasmid maintenance system antidote protein VapI
MNPVHVRLLSEALADARLTHAELAKALAIPVADLRNYLEGTRELTDEQFLSLLSVVSRSGNVKGKAKPRERRP